MRGITSINLEIHNFTITMLNYNTNVNQRLDNFICSIINKYSEELWHVACSDLRKLFIFYVYCVDKDEMSLLRLTYCVLQDSGEYIFAG